MLKDVALYANGFRKKRAKDDDFNTVRYNPFRSQKTSILLFLNSPPLLVRIFFDLK
jgi:hypothetical protein